MRRWFLPLTVSTVGIAAGWMVLEVLRALWSPNQEVGPFSFFYLDLALLVTAAPAGVWGYRNAGSAPQLLVGLVAPLAYVAAWAWLLHSMGECRRPCLALSYTPMEYAEGLSPLLGALSGYASAALLARSGRSSI